MPTLYVASTGFTTFPTTTPTTVTGTPSPPRPLTPEETICIANLASDLAATLAQICSSLEDVVGFSLLLLEDTFRKSVYFGK